MGEVTRTELNQQTARVLARVARGEHLTVTDRGRAVAELSPAATTPWDALVASGRVTPARARGPLPFEPIDSDEPSGDTLTALRADRP